MISIGIAQTIFQDAHTDGISNILYLGFYYLPGLERAADYANPKLKRVCEEAPVDCYFIDPRYNETTGKGLQTPKMLGSDHIHPNEEGYKILASMIWNVSVMYNATI
jgi:lysophospholipase L1-like esterase